MKISLFTILLFDHWKIATMDLKDFGYFIDTSLRDFLNKEIFQRFLNWAFRKSLKYCALSFWADSPTPTPYWGGGETDYLRAIQWIMFNMGHLTLVSLPLKRTSKFETRVQVGKGSPTQQLRKTRLKLKAQYIFWQIFVIFQHKRTPVPLNITVMGTFWWVSVHYPFKTPMKIFFFF